MKKLLCVSAVALLAGCAAPAPTPPAKVVWLYGAGNGDGVSYPGPKPTFSRTWGAGNGDGVVNPAAATVNKKYSYGAEGMSSSMVQFDPTPAAPK